MARTKSCRRSARRSARLPPATAASGRDVALKLLPSGFAADPRSPAPFRAGSARRRCAEPSEHHRRLRLRLRLGRLLRRFPSFLRATPSAPALPRAFRRGEPSSTPFSLRAVLPPPTPAASSTAI